MSQKEMSIVFVRHGAATHNAAFVTEGEAAYSNPIYADARLLDSAKEAIIKTREGITIPIHLILTSPLTRCLETTRILAARWPNVLIASFDDLTETQGGGHCCNQRRSIDALEEEFPEMQFYCSDAIDPERFRGRRETPAEVRTRIMGLLHKLPANESILIVTHHDCIESLTGVSLRNAESLVLARKALGI